MMMDSPLEYFLYSSQKMGENLLLETTMNQYVFMILVQIK
jgi:hypothetical protein